MAVGTDCSCPGVLVFHMIIIIYVSRCQLAAGWCVISLGGALFRVRVCVPRQRKIVCDVKVTMKKMNARNQFVALSNCLPPKNGGSY